MAHKNDRVKEENKVVLDGELGRAIHLLFEGIKGDADASLLGDMALAKLRVESIADMIDSEETCPECKLALNACMQSLMAYISSLMVFMDHIGLSDKAMDLWCDDEDEEDED